MSQGMTSSRAENPSLYFCIVIPNEQSEGPAFRALPEILKQKADPSTTKVVLG